MSQKTLLLFFALALCTDASVISYECRHGNYQTLGEQSRLFTSDDIMSTINDANLEAGWYRFEGAGVQMKEGFEDVTSNKTELYPCGGELVFSLVNPHPRVNDGIVRNVVQGCMFKSVCMETCKWTPICDSKLEADIMVRNCGDFHVYFLSGAKLLGTDQPKMPNSPTRGVYCSDNMRTNTEVSPRLECRTYVNLTDSTRLWEANDVKPDYARFPQDPLFTNQWTRMLTNDYQDMSLVEGCPSVVTDHAKYKGTPPCGALYRGWLSQRHPKYSGGILDMEMCFSTPTSCDCIASSHISVINCGDFYIYKRRQFPRREARACTAIGVTEPTVTLPTEYIRSNTLCGNELKIIDDTRYWSGMNFPSKVQCDVKYHQACHFESTSGKSLKIQEGCPMPDPAFLTGRCQSNNALWLDGEHPTVEMGPTPRYVCLHSVRKDASLEHMQARNYSSCQCLERELIMVQNCESHYTYELNPLPDCKGRYCVETKDGSMPQLPESKPEVTEDENACQVANEIPFECQVGNHQTLQGDHRLFTSRNSPFDDSQLATGWYRFKDGQQMKEDQNIPKELGLSIQLSQCGSTYFRDFNFQMTSLTYTLKQPHPRQEDGLVKRDMSVCQYAGRSTTQLLRRICKDSATYVRNCGDFHVYYLSPARKEINSLLRPRKSGTYCAENMMTKPEEMPRMECSRYVNVTDNGRYWDSYGPLSSQCGDVNHTTQWSRFITDSITDAMIPEGCPSMSSSKNISLKNVPCGAVYRGWVNGQHPAAGEGVKKLSMCFSGSSTCKCQATTDISVINCGDFYVYKRGELPLCRAKACTVPKPKILTPPATTANPKEGHMKQLNLCAKYSTIIDDTRSVTDMNPAFKQCDLKFTTPVRFVSTKGEYLKLNEDCSSNNITFPIGRCNSDIVTWLNTPHPKVEDGVIAGTVCSNLLAYPHPSAFVGFTPCQCNQVKHILIQNCSTFYVYMLEPYSRCSSRYCLQETGKFNTSSNTETCPPVPTKQTTTTTTAPSSSTTTTTQQPSTSTTTTTTTQPPTTTTSTTTTTQPPTTTTTTTTTQPSPTTTTTTQPPPTTTTSTTTTQPPPTTTTSTTTTQPPPTTTTSTTTAQPPPTTTTSTTTTQPPPPTTTSTTTTQPPPPTTTTTQPPPITTTTQPSPTTEAESDCDSNFCASSTNPQTYNYHPTNNKKFYVCVGARTFCRDCAAGTVWKGAFCGFA